MRPTGHFPHHKSLFKVEKDYVRLLVRGKRRTPLHEQTISLSARNHFLHLWNRTKEKACDSKGKWLMKCRSLGQLVSSLCLLPQREQTLHRKRTSHEADRCCGSSLPPFRHSVKVGAGRGSPLHLPHQTADIREERGRWLTRDPEAFTAVLSSNQTFPLGRSLQRYSLQRTA
jgi:hypothetical protein